MILAIELTPAENITLMLCGTFLFTLVLVGVYKLIRNTPGED